MNLPVQKYDLSALDDAHKSAALAQMPLGTVLFWSGHEMFYLGQESGKTYVISATGSVGDIYGESTTVNQIKTVIINALDVVRGNRTTWLSNITCANIPYIPATEIAPSVYDVAFYEKSAVWPESSFTVSAASNGESSNAACITLIQLWGAKTGLVATRSGGSQAFGQGCE